MTLDNSIVYVGSRNFKHFNKTRIYKILNEKQHDDNFNENTFLNKKEKWYKTKYTSFQLDQDKISHLFRKKLISNITYPSFNNKSISIVDTKLCHKDIKKADVF